MPCALSWAMRLSAPLQPDHVTPHELETFTMTGDHATGGLPYSEPSPPPSTSSIPSRTSGGKRVGTLSVKGSTADTASTTTALPSVRRRRSAAGNELSLPASSGAVAQPDTSPPTA